MSVTTTSRSADPVAGRVNGCRHQRGLLPDMMVPSKRLHGRVWTGFNIRECRWRAVSGRDGILRAVRPDNGDRRNGRDKINA